MRGLVALVVALAVASMSGCVELVGEEDPELQAAADEAAQALEHHQSRVGHISGQVVGADGQPLAGAIVDLVTVAQVKTDEAGRFSFLDLTPGEYSVAAEAIDHLAASTDLSVAAGQYSRPRIQLEPQPAPEPYFEVYSMEGYDQLNVLGLGMFSCYSCSFDGTLGEEGLAEVVFEARLHQSMPTGSRDLEWLFAAYDANESSEFSGYEPSPMRITIPGEDIADGATDFHAHVSPGTSLVAMNQAYAARLSLFYYEGAPEGYSAFDLE
jgi:hypothetical protein